MGRKKGRQSGGFASKSMRAAHVSEWKSRALEEVPRRPFQRTKGTKQTMASSASNTTRPKLLLSRLHGILQERQFQDRLDDRASRRRRQQMTMGLVQQQQQRQEQLKVKETQQVHGKPGWILYDGESENEFQIKENDVPSLQVLCLCALGPAMPDYLEALGRKTLHSVMSLLTWPTLAALSLVVSRTVGMNDDLTFVLGNHTHVEKLCLISHESDLEHWEPEEPVNDKNGLTDAGLNDIVPKLTLTGPLDNEGRTDDSWERLEETIEMEGCVRLKRLELGNARHLSTHAVEMLLSKCSSITHLSLQKSLQWNSGHEIMLILHLLLPGLALLDVSCCSWVTEGLLRTFWNNYENNDKEEPVVCVAGCVSLSNVARQELLQEFPNKLLIEIDRKSSNAESLS